MAKILKTFLLVFAAYLLQVCVMPYLRISGITANVLIAVISVITVAYGRLFTFGAGAVAGILMETMNASIMLIKLVIYPVGALFASLFFADKSERRLEQERSLGKKAKNLPPHLRTLLCAVVNIAVYEMVHLVYIYLTGVSIGLVNISRSVVNVLYTAFVTLVVMAPARKFLGMYRRPARRIKTL